MARCSGVCPSVAERGQHVRLGLPFLRFHFLAEILVDRRRTCAVEQHENFEFLFMSFCRCSERSGDPEGSSVRSSAEMFRFARHDVIIWCA